MSIQRPRIAKRLVPLLDVLFLLLAFFIVMPHGMRSVQRKLAPPPDWQAKEIEELVELRQDADGRVRFGDNFYTLDEFPDVQGLPGPESKSMVLVRVAWSTRWRDAKKLRAQLDERKLVYVVLQEK